MILSKPGRHARFVLCLWLLMSGAAFAQNETVVVRRSAQLQEAPGGASRVLASLAPQTAATRLGERQGPWIKIRTAGGAQGWVHLFDIGTAGSAQPGNAGTAALRSITGFFNKGSAQGNGSVPTSTVGIRGLGAEDLANAQPDMAAVARADGNRADAGQARQFAASASLASRNVAPLAAPAAPARPPSSGGAGLQFQSGG